MTSLKITFLGTSSATPTRERGLPSIALRREGEVILMDCGEGAQSRFVQYGVGLNKEMLILITHLHGDHVNGLLGLLQTMSMSQRVRKLTIVAPSPLLDWLKLTMRVIHVGLTFEVSFIATKVGTVYRGRDYRILAARADHSVESYCYLYEELPRPGVFDSDAASRLGIPMGAKWSRLQHGHDIIVEGKRFRPGDVMGPKRPGRKVGYSGDTRPTKRMVKFFSGADALIFDSTFSSKDAHRAIERKHSTSVEAARLAKEAGVKRLFLTHFSARYRSVGALVREARVVFPGAAAAKDGYSVDLPYPDEPAAAVAAAVRQSVGP